MLADREIRALIDEGVLADADSARVGQVTYDLRNRTFYREGVESELVSLMPGDSVFVGARESVRLPADLTARVALKNSRIRQGLSLAAPIYFPGHATRLFFRVTNVSADEITLDVAHDIAQVWFERLATPVASPYAGEFADEFDYSGLGTYRDVYGSETRKLEREAEKIEGMEQRIYGNVIAIMGVFVAIFSLINVDMAWISASMPISALVILDLSIVGGMSALVGLVSVMLGPKRTKAFPWLVALASFAVAALLPIVTR